MTDIGELVVRIKADASQLQAELAKTSSSVKQSAGTWRQSLAIVKDELLSLAPAFSAVAFAAFIKGSIDSAENMIHMADRIGFSIETLSALDASLRENGSSVEEFAGSIKFMNRNLEEAAALGNGRAFDAFNSLGLSISKLRAMRPEDEFIAIANALGKVTDQGKLTADVMAIFGRSGAALIPILKESGGNIEELIKKAKDLGLVIGSKQADEIKTFEKAWVEMTTHMSRAALDAMPAINLLLNGIEGIVNLPSHAFAAGNDLAKALGVAGNPNVSFTRPQTVDHATFIGAAGNNEDVGRPKNSELQTYIKNLQQETSALGLSEKALFMQKAEIQANSDARKDWENHLRASPSLTDAEKTKVDQLAGSFYDLSKAQKEAEQQARRMQQALSDGLADIATDWSNAGDSIKSTIQSIAKEIVKAQITTPLSQALIGGPSAPGLLGNLLKFLPHFASGGTVNGPSVVGENGPELFIPQGSGAIVPNNKIGGTSIVVQQTINLSPGLAETVNASIMNAAPNIAAMAHASVVQAMQKGGSESRIVGKRS